MKDIKEQRGAILPMALILLTVMALLGASAASISNTRAQMVTNQMRYAQLEQAAENVLSRRIHDYPTNVDESLASLNLDSDISITDTHSACMAVQRTNKAPENGGGGTPGGIGVGHGGGGGEFNVSGSAEETKFYNKGNRVWSRHPHLKSDEDWQDELGASPSSQIVSLYIDGDVTINDCGGGFTGNDGGRIFYTGTITPASGANCPDDNKSWPDTVEAYKITQTEMNGTGTISASAMTHGRDQSTYVSNTQVSGSTGLGFTNIADVYKISEVSVTAKDEVSSAEVTLTMGIKSHKSNEDLDALNIDFPNCIPDNYATVLLFRDSTQSNDDLLNETGDFRVLYVYQNVN